MALQNMSSPTFSAACFAPDDYEDPDRQPEGPRYPNLALGKDALTGVTCCSDISPPPRVPPGSSAAIANRGFAAPTGHRD